VGHDVVAMIVAMGLAAGLNLYATTGTLGILARAGVVTLPPSIAMLGNEWVIGASVILFAIEFFADKIPVFDLVWNAAHTFVRAPAAALLAWSATSGLSPTGQVITTIAGGLIALAAHGTKLAMRGTVTASPEPFSNTVLSIAEDVVAIGLTWFATTHPYIAAAIAIVLLIVMMIVIRWIWRTLRSVVNRFRLWLATRSASGSPVRHG